MKENLELKRLAFATLSEGARKTIHIINNELIAELPVGRFIFGTQEDREE